MSHARIVVKGATTALTRRTAFRKLLWTPSHPVVTQGYLFALGMAQVKTGVLVHHGTLMPNHAHVTVTPTAENLPAFTRRLNRESSCFLKAYLTESGYEPPPNVWDDRDPHCMRLVDAGAMLAWLVYEHVNCVTAGLVRDVGDYPGWVSDFGAMKRGVLVVDKPPLYFGRRCPKQVELALTPPPLLTHVYGGDLDKLVYDLEVMARRHQQSLRREMGDVLGPDGVKRQHPWAEPQTMREPPGQRVPQFKVGGGAGDAREVRVRCAREQRGFRARYADDRRRYRAGESKVVFPYGTYGMRVVNGAQVDDAPPPDAILTAPGPLPGDDPTHVCNEFDRRLALEDADSLLGSDALLASGGSAKAENRRSIGGVRPAMGTTPRPPRSRPLRTAQRHATRVVPLHDRAPGDPDPAPS